MSAAPERRVYGSAVDMGAILPGGLTEWHLRHVEAPENALAAVSEGFCPSCPGSELAGDTGLWCRSCEVSWHIR